MVGVGATVEPGPVSAQPEIWQRGRVSPVSQHYRIVEQMLEMLSEIALIAGV
jgi:hypothetical protein